MLIINLYRYTREGGGVTVTTHKPECEYTKTFRLVADDGEILTDGENFVFCVDTDTPNIWQAIDIENSGFSYEETEEKIEHIEEEMIEGDYAE